MPEPDFWFLTKRHLGTPQLRAGKWPLRGRCWPMWGALRRSSPAIAALRPQGPSGVTPRPPGARGGRAGAQTTPIRPLAGSEALVGARPVWPYTTPAGAVTTQHNRGGCGQLRVHYTPRGPSGSLEWRGACRCAPGSTKKLIPPNTPGIGWANQKTARIYDAMVLLAQRLRSTCPAYLTHRQQV